MKRIMVYLLALCVLFGMTAFAEGSGNEVETIQFRGLDWYSDKATVEDAMSEFEPIKYASLDDTAFKYGPVINYKDVPVAGHKFEAEISFLYASEDGEVDYNEDSAQMYHAQYACRVTWVEANPENIDALYDELVSKMTGLYGKGSTETDDNVISKVPMWVATAWEASDGSACAVEKVYSYLDSKYTELYVDYYAPGDRDRLDELDALFSAGNADNVDGL